MTKVMVDRIDRLEIIVADYIAEARIDRIEARIERKELRIEREELRQHRKEVVELLTTLSTAVVALIDLQKEGCSGSQNDGKVDAYGGSQCLDHETGK